MESNYRNILIAIPPVSHEWYEQPADVIRKAAASLCAAKNVKLIFLGVFSLEQEVGTGEVNLLPPENMMEIVKGQEKKHADDVRNYVRWFAENGVPYTIVMAQGDPAEVIAQKAQEYNADLILMGYHHKTSIFDIFSPDVAGRTIKQAHCDVMLVTAHKGK